MFVQRRAAQLRTFQRFPRGIVAKSGKRHFTDLALDGFLDLAIGLPWPSSFPPYSSTIILLTVASRLAFTVPFSVWAKRRQWRAEELVMPALLEAKTRVEKQVLHEMRVEQPRGTKEELRKVYSERVKKIMIARRNELFAKHRCRPWITMFVPPVTQLPLFMGSSMFLSRLSQPPTVFDSESFLTLTSLSHADPTAALPIALGIITLANVESSRWFISQPAKHRDEVEQKKIAGKRAQGQFVFETRKMVQSGLRLLSVGRILIGAVVPGSVVLYWVSSATFGLFQSWVFDYWERQRPSQRKLPILQASSAPSESGGKLASAPVSVLKPKRK